MPDPSPLELASEAAVPLGDGIHVVDTGFVRPRFDAAYLIVERGRAAFVDAGTNHSVPRLLAALDSVGLAPAAVDFVIATHAHLDHAGGVGLLMRHLPKARLVAHPRAATHLIDPTRLVAGATAVYGAEEIERSYGAVVSVPAERVLQSTDGMTIELGGRPLLLLHTPGHALHHHCIWDLRSRSFFSGDSFGVSYREFDTARGPWIVPTSAPVQFQPDALRRSVERMLSFSPRFMQVTHYGRVGDVPRLGALFLEQLEAMVTMARSLAPGPDRHAALMRGLEPIHLASLRAHGVALSDAKILELMQLDFELNAQGIGIWLDREPA
ncbi:MAG: MBL fold metallo-hydrolase [Pseudomonadota bacterium]|nr:MBL fold metallo-hydrolase [Pseudomonadota bacterium]